jgi:hypothetical protein
MTTAADWYPKDLQSRLESRRLQVYHPRLGLMDLVFCASCHKPRGAVNTHCESVVMLCDDCVARYGGLPARQLTQQELDAIGARTVKEN